MIEIRREASHDSSVDPGGGGEEESYDHSRIEVDNEDEDDEEDDEDPDEDEDDDDEHRSDGKHEKIFTSLTIGFPLKSTYLGHVESRLVGSSLCLSTYRWYFSDELFKFSFVVILGEEIEAEEDEVPNNEEGGDEGVVVESYNGVIMLEDEGEESEDHDDDDDDDEDDEGSEEKCSVECSEFAVLFRDQPQSLRLHA